MPLIRAFFGSLVCCHQARLRTFPGNNVLGTRGDEICSRIKKSGQERRVQVTLDGTNAALALVPALPEWLFDERSAAMAKLGEFRRACGNFYQGAARACNGASE